MIPPSLPVTTPYGSGSTAGPARRTAIALLSLLLVACVAPPVAGVRARADDSHLRCSLPVIVIPPSGSPIAAGFLAIPGGLFTADPHADVSRTPNAQVPASRFPVWYDWSIRRWLPVSAPLVAPDGRRYAYSVTKSGAVEVRIHSLVDGSDRFLWSGGGPALAWTPDGIFTGSGVIVDPTTGHARAYTGEIFGQRPPSPGESSAFGFDQLGNPVVRSGGREAGTPYTVVIDLGEGRRTTIYVGTEGDLTDFEPFGATPDGDRIWMGNSDGRLVWLWSPRAGLQRFPVLGGGPAGGATKPAGGCR